MNRFAPYWRHLTRAVPKNFMKNRVHSLLRGITVRGVLPRVVDTECRDLAWLDALYVEPTSSASKMIWQSQSERTYLYSRRTQESTHTVPATIGCSYAPVLRRGNLYSRLCNAGPIENGSEFVSIDSGVSPASTQLSQRNSSMTLLAGCMKARSVKFASPSTKKRVVVPASG